MYLIEGGKSMGYRKDYKNRVFEVLNEEKLDCIGADDMTLRQVLDCWWNSVRIEGNICYKNAYEEDPEYELDRLTPKDLDRKVYVDSWDTDEDGYPICYARFDDDDEDGELTPERKMAIKILDGLNVELYGDDYYKVEDFITDILSGNVPKKVYINYLKCYLRQEVRDYLESNTELEEDDELYVSKDMASDGEFIEEVVEEILDENDYHGMGIINMDLFMDMCDDMIRDRKENE